MITKEEINKILKNVGLNKGMHVLVHCSLRSIGPIDGGADTLIDSLLETVGQYGTVAMPSFNYTYAIPQPYFDVKTTPGLTGALTEVFRLRPQTIRSFHPTHSVLAQGIRAEEFLTDHLSTEAMGLDSPIDRIAMAGGYVLLIGVTHISNSTIHIGEAHANVKKFLSKEGSPPIAKIMMPSGEIIEHNIDVSTSCAKAFNVVDYWIRQKNKIIDLSIGNAFCFLMKGLDIINVVGEMIRTQPDVLFCRTPNCRRCRLGIEYALLHRIHI